jgi:hypothetical protein
LPSLRLNGNDQKNTCSRRQPRATAYPRWRSLEHVLDAERLHSYPASSLETRPSARIILRLACRASLCSLLPPLVSSLLPVKFTRGHGRYILSGSILGACASASASPLASAGHQMTGQLARLNVVSHSGGYRSIVPRQTSKFSTDWNISELVEQVETQHGSTIEEHLGYRLDIGLQSYIAYLQGWLVI